MTTANCAVTAGYTYTKDSDGKFQITLTNLNKLGIPVVTVNLADKIATADIIALAVTAAKLENTVADAILTATATVGNSVARANPIQVALQIKDIQGNALAQQCVVQWWLSNAASADLVPTSSIPDQALVYTNGNYVVNIANSATALGVTDSNGKLYLTFQHNAGAITRYFYASVNGKLISGSQGLIWT